MASFTFKFEVIIKEQAPVKSKKFGEGKIGVLTRRVAKEVRRTDDRKIGVKRAFQKKEEARYTTVLVDDNGNVTRDKNKGVATKPVNTIRPIHDSDNTMEEVIEGAAVRWTIEINDEDHLIQDVVTLGEMRQIYGGAWYDDVEEITRFAGPTSLVTEFVTPTMTGETALLILAKCPFLSQYSYEIIEEWLDKEPSTRCDELITAVTYGINALIDAGKFPDGIPKVTCALSDNGQFYDTIDPS